MKEENMGQDVGKAEFRVRSATRCQAVFEEDGETPDFCEKSASHWNWQISTESIGENSASERQDAKNSKTAAGRQNECNERQVSERLNICSAGRRHEQVKCVVVRCRGVAVNSRRGAT